MKWLAVGAACALCLFESGAALARRHLATASHKPPLVHHQVYNLTTSKSAMYFVAHHGVRAHNVSDDPKFPYGYKGSINFWKTDLPKIESELGIHSTRFMNEIKAHLRSGKDWQPHPDRPGVYVAPAQLSNGIWVEVSLWRDPNGGEARASWREIKDPNIAQSPARVFPVGFDATAIKFIASRGWDPRFVKEAIENIPPEQWTHNVAILALGDGVRVEIRRHDLESTISLELLDTPHASNNSHKKKFPELERKKKYAFSDGATSHLRLHMREDFGVAARIIKSLPGWQRDDSTGYLFTHWKPEGSPLLRVTIKPPSSNKKDYYVDIVPIESAPAVLQPVSLSPAHDALQPVSASPTPVVRTPRAAYNETSSAK